jgi:hypothetical protein
MKQITTLHRKWLAKTDPKTLALFLKHDYLLLKNLTIINKRVAWDQTKIWRKTKATLPRYLTALLNLWPRLLPHEKVVVLSYFRFYRLLERPVKVDLETVVTPPGQGVEEYCLCLLKQISAQWPLLGQGFNFKGIKASPSIDHTSYFSPGAFGSGLWTSRRPLGKRFLRVLLDMALYVTHPSRVYPLDCLITEFRSLWAFPKYYDRFYLVKDLLGWFSGDRLIQLRLWLLPTKVQEAFKNGVNRKLIYFPDGLGKNRYIAIADWVTQATLKPLSDAMFVILKKLSTDYTFDQDRSVKTVQKWYAEGKDIYSFDLTAATDRLPILLQGGILNLIGLSQTGVAAWVSIMVEDPFHTNTGPVWYGTGQGIGMYSSWRTIAVTHHLLIRLAAIQAGFKHTFQDYIVLGDDVVIASSEVAREYKSIITGLGVGISSMKSITPKGRYNSAEFASRLVCNGVDISPLPYGLILKSDVWSLLGFVTAWHDHFLACNGEKEFWQLLEDNGPEIKSQVGGFLGLLNTLGVPTEVGNDLLTLWGSVYWLQKGAGVGRTDRLSRWWQTVLLSKPFPGITSPLYQLMVMVPLSFWKELKISIFMEEQRCIKQAVSKLSLYAYEHVQLITHIRKTEGWNDSLSYLITTHWIKDWMNPAQTLFASPFMRAETKVQEALLDTLSRFRLGEVIGQTISPSLRILLQPNVLALTDIERDMFEEIILLSRGPRGMLNSISSKLQDKRLSQWPQMVALAWLTSGTAKVLTSLGLISKEAGKLSLKYGRLPSKAVSMALPLPKGGGKTWVFVKGKKVTRTSKSSIFAKMRKTSKHSGLWASKKSKIGKGHASL